MLRSESATGVPDSAVIEIAGVSVLISPAIAMNAAM
jgi:hypothetical protein